MPNARYLSLEPEKKPLLRRIAGYARCMITNRDLLKSAILGQVRQFIFPGTLKGAVIESIREAAKNNIGTASIFRIHPDARLPEIQKALKKTIDDIDGFAFLDKPPDTHTVLIKIGVNWGLGGYPTITSPESIYAVTRICLEEAEKRRRHVNVRIGDESGIEVKRMARAKAKMNEKLKNLTRKNFEEAGVFAAAQLAALHHAEDLEKKGIPGFDGAGKLVEDIGGRDGFDPKGFSALPPELARKLRKWRKLGA